MPFTAEVDHDASQVRSVWEGIADEAQLIAYIDEVWSDPSVRGYCELIDFRAVTRVDVPSEAIATLAGYSRAFDNPDRPAKSAIVAPQALVFGLSRMFASLRGTDPEDRRTWRVFEDYQRACKWLDS